MNIISYGTSLLTAEAQNDGQSADSIEAAGQTILAASGNTFISSSKEGKNNNRQQIVT